ncbi:MAG: LacI family DNA-binding transcriptional regulator [Opitutae bacterium]|nr:LacI family DNA-binding transcriptional regulator [Opitutae bacterium]
MKDVAARAKTSVATVSKCLRGVPTIPASTRERVNRIAQQMGYRLHPYISALMRNRRKRRAAVAQAPTLAYVTAFPTENGWQREMFFRSLYAGARHRAEARGYVLQPFWLYRDDMTNERFSEILWARGIRGMLLSPFPRLGMEIHLQWEHFSVVAHGLSLAHPVFHRTSNDHYQSMMLVMAECRRRGYTRPGFALDVPTGERLEFRWEAAYRVSGEKLGFKMSVPPLMTSTRWEPERMCKWIKREKPDVVITLMLEDQVRELTKRGLRIPEDVGLASLSVSQPGSPLSGVLQNPSAMGAVAVEQLINMVERNETGVPEDPITLTLSGRWNPGRTVRKLAAEASEGGLPAPG